MFVGGIFWHFSHDQNGGFFVGKFTQRKLQKFRKWAPKKKKKRNKTWVEFLSIWWALQRRQITAIREKAAGSSKRCMACKSGTEMIVLVFVFLVGGKGLFVFWFDGPDSLPLSPGLSWGCALFEFSFPGYVKRVSGNVWHPLVLMVSFSLPPWLWGFLWRSRKFDGALCKFLLIGLQEKQTLKCCTAASQLLARAAHCCCSPLPPFLRRLTLCNFIV